MKSKVARLIADRPMGLANSYAYSSDAGIDLMVITEGDAVRIGPREFVEVPTNVAVEIQQGFFGRIYPRSSFIKEHRGNLLVLSSPIDAGYTGELKVLVKNIGDGVYWLQRGSRIASLVVIPCEQIEQEEVGYELMPASTRGANGFGSSGK